MVRITQDGFCCHSRERGNQTSMELQLWIPAFAGMSEYIHRRNSGSDILLPLRNFIHRIDGCECVQVKIFKFSCDGFGAFVTKGLL